MVSQTKTTFTSQESANLAFRFWTVKKAAEDWLQHSPYLELRNVSCDFHEGVITIRGCVPSYYLKQLAQSLLCDMEDVLEVNNQLEVVASGDARRSYFNPSNCSRFALFASL